MIFLSNYCISMIERLLETPDERIVMPQLFPSPTITESKGFILKVTSTSALLSGHCVSFNFLENGGGLERGMRTMPITVI